MRNTRARSSEDYYGEEGPESEEDACAKKNMEIVECVNDENPSCDEVSTVESGKIPYLYFRSKT